MILRVCVVALDLGDLDVPHALEGGVGAVEAEGLNEDKGISFFCTRMFYWPNRRMLTRVAVSPVFLPISAYTAERFQ